MGNLVQQPNNLKDLKVALASDSVVNRFKEMLGKKSAGFLTSIMNIVSNNELLKKASVNSIILAASQAAALDLPINPNLGYAAIIPYKNKSGSVDIQFQLMRSGWVELALRTGQVVKLVNEAVYEGELVSKNRFTDEYVFDETKRVSDTVIGYMAYIKLTNGFEKTVYWTIEEVKRHALRYSQTYKKGYGVWVDNFDAMAKKTLVKNLIIKYVPKSIQLVTATEADQASFTGDIDNPKPVYVDNPQNDEVGEAVDFEEVDTDSGEVQQEEEPKTVIVVEEDEPNINGELFNEEETKQ